MKHIIAALLLGAVSAQSHSDHAAYIDQSASDKQLGLVKWQYFFQKYVVGKYDEIVDPDTGYDAHIHACWF